MNKKCQLLTLILLLVVGVCDVWAQSADVASVTTAETTTGYTTFSAAISAAESAGTATVTLLQSCSTEVFSIATGKDITLVGGQNTLTIQGSLNATSVTILGKLTIRGGYFVAATSMTMSSALFHVSQTGTLVIDDGIINAESGHAVRVYGNFVANGGVLKGALSSTAYGLYAESGSTVTLNGGTFSGGTSSDGGSIHVEGASVRSILGTNMGYFEQDPVNHNWFRYTGSMNRMSIQSMVRVQDGRVASVCSNGVTTDYVFFSEAWDAANNAGGGQITLLDDATGPDTYLSMRSNATISIDGGEHTLLLTNPIFIDEGWLKIESGCIKIQSFMNAAVKKDEFIHLGGGKLTVNGGTIDASEVSVGTNGIQIASGELTINGGTVKGSNVGAKRALVVGGGTVTLNGGCFTGHDGALWLKSGMKVTDVLGGNKGYYGEDGSPVFLDLMSNNIGQAICVGDAVLTMVENANPSLTAYYHSVSSAFNAANTKGPVTITLLRDCSADQVSVDSQSKITFVGGSHTLTLTAVNNIQSGLSVNGELTIRSGTFRAGSDMANLVAVLYSWQGDEQTEEYRVVGAKLTVEDGYFEVGSSYTGHAIHVSAPGSFVAHGGTFRGSTKAGSGCRGLVAQFTDYSSNFQITLSGGEYVGVDGGIFLPDNSHIYLCDILAPNKGYYIKWGSASWEYSAIRTHNHHTNIDKSVRVLDVFSLTIGSKGWASLYLPFDAWVPENTTVYYIPSGDVTDNTLTMTAMTNPQILPAGNGVFVHADPGTYEFTVANPNPLSPTSQISPLTNIVTGVTEATTCEANANYVLNLAQSSASQMTLGLYTGTTLGANKAYIPASALSGVQAGVPLRVVAEGQVVTEIEEVTDTESAPRKILENGHIRIVRGEHTYDINGRIVKLDPKKQ